MQAMKHLLTPPFIGRHTLAIIPRSRLTDPIYPTINLLLRTITIDKFPSWKVPKRIAIYPEVRNLTTSGGILPSWIRSPSSMTSTLRRPPLRQTSEKGKRYCGLKKVISKVMLCTKTVHWFVSFDFVLWNANIRLTIIFCSCHLRIAPHWSLR